MKKKSSKKENVSKPINKNQDILTFILIALFGVLVIFFTTSKLTNEDDYFWHLATGRYIVQNGTIPTQDVFSFPTIGQTWLVTEWGWDVLTYFIFNSFSYLGLSLLNTLTFLIIFFIYIFLLEKFKVSYSLIILFSLVLIFGIFERLTPRPHIITYLFFTVLMGFIINYKYFDRSGFKKLFFIPLIFLIWANMHMGCIIGIGIFGIFLISEIIIYLKPTKFSTKDNPPLNKKDLIRVLVIFVVSILCMMINPHGVYTYIYSLTSQANAKMLHEAIMEWISPFNPRITGKFHNYIYMFFLAGILPIIYYSIKKKDFFMGLLCFLFALNSLRAIRFTVDYLIIAFPFFVLSINYLVSKLRNNNFRETITTKPHLKIILILSVLILIYGVPDNKLYHRYLKYARFAGIGLDENFYPVKMFNFIKENKIEEIGTNPFNTFECGGFYIWNFPDKMDFFDSRDLNDYIMNEYQTLISRLPGYEKKIDEYNFDYAICVLPDIVAEPPIMKQLLTSYFATHDETWKLVFWNDRGLLFLKNLPKFSKIIEDNEYKYFTPYNLYFQKNKIEEGIANDKKRLLEEVDRRHNEDPSSIFLNNFLVLYRNKLL